jgi:hypothetical protein
VLPLADLVDPADAGAERVRELLAHAQNPVEVFRGDRARGERALLRVQASTATLLGAVAYRLGGLVFDHGWLRFLAAGAPRLGRDLVSWNGPPERPRLPGALLVADDAAGGFFAVDQGAFGGPAGAVHYLAPDGDGPEPLDLDYPGLLDWACNGDLDAFYEDTRWPGWEVEVLGLGLDLALSFAPRRTRVSLEEAWARVVARGRPPG